MLGGALSVVCCCFNQLKDGSETVAAKNVWLSIYKCVTASAASHGGAGEGGSGVRQKKSHLENFAKKGFDRRAPKNSLNSFGIDEKSHLPNL